MNHPSLRFPKATIDNNGFYHQLSSRWFEKRSPDHLTSII